MYSYQQQQQQQQQRHDSSFYKMGTLVVDVMQWKLLESTRVETQEQQSTVLVGDYQTTPRTGRQVSRRDKTRIIVREGLLLKYVLT
jgi:hypothetical protein